MDAGDICKVCGKFSFLLFNCDVCAGKFCEAHRFGSSHGCSDEMEIEDDPPSSEPVRCMKCSQHAVMICRECGFSVCATHRYTDRHECSKFTERGVEIRK